MYFSLEVLNWENSCILFLLHCITWLDTMCAKREWIVNTQTRI